MVYPGDPIPGASFPCWVEPVYTLLKTGGKLIPQSLEICGSKVRLCDFDVEIPQLLQLVPVSFLIQRDITWDLLCNFRFNVDLCHYDIVVRNTGSQGKQKYCPRANIHLTNTLFR